MIVAVPDSFPATSAHALVIRYAGPNQQDVILLNPAGATVEALAVALTTLRERRTSRSMPLHTEVTTIQDFAPRGAAHRAYARLERVLNDLLAQRRSRIGNLGLGRWIELADPRVH
ncbi:MAG TPA: hypothetical protein VF188_18895 [Longimicrobiales bacterium]